MFKQYPLAVGIALVISAFSAPAWSDEPISPVAPVKAVNLAQVELGKKLYFDPRLSRL